MSGSGGKPPFFDGSNYGYWKVRMASYLEAISLDAWRVTDRGFTPPVDEENLNGLDYANLQANAKAKNAIFEGLSLEVFNRVSNLPTSKLIWDALRDVHEGSHAVREEKYQLLKGKLESFHMLPNENANDMFSRLNVIVNDINGLGLAKIEESEIVRKMLRVLKKATHFDYKTICTVINNGDLEDMTTVKLLGKITQHEMFEYGDLDDSSSKKKAIAFKASQDKKKKAKCESSDGEEGDDDDSDNEMALLMRKTTRMLKKLNKGGYEFDSSKKKFTPINRSLANVDCFNCGELGHMAHQCTKPKKNKNKSKSKSDDKKNNKTKKDDKSRRKFFKAVKGKDGKLKAMFGEWLTSDDENSSDDDEDEASNDESEGLAGLALKESIPPPPPTSSSTHLCLMAKGDTKVSDDESFELPSYNVLFEEYSNCSKIILKNKSKHKALKELYKSLLDRHNDLESKYNALSSKHDNLAKIHDDLVARHDKLRLEYIEMNERNESLELTCDAMSHDKYDASHVTKVDISTSCDDLVDTTCDSSNDDVHKFTNLVKENEKLKHDLEMYRDGVHRLTRGEELGRKVMNNVMVRDSTFGFGYVPNRAIDGSNSIKFPWFVKEDEPKCSKCGNKGHDVKDCTYTPKPIASTSRPCFLNTHYVLKKLSNGKVVARFMGTHARKKYGFNFPKQIWVSKSLVANVKGPNMVWVPKVKT